MWSLLFALGTIGLSGCDKDDEHLGEDVYQGYIQDIMCDDFFIKVVEAPYVANLTDKTPQKGHLISVSSDDFSDYDLKIQQKISFRIISAQQQVIHPDFLLEDPNWICEIAIIKIY